eukprot:CAMPEP_0195513098 /NCGR_PEP_ID=MMETSP0794_2-20130614/4837_1 /TAXON_ID=515487 /ORGANISM="Stephanopyxis turris, Strain CCMP 815" /LENGTH=749 /DNA_ID=CAMNT_0040641027 /DNA_START=208 /DNA_END=2457 /DNA_ORIENTATION=+
MMRIRKARNLDERSVALIKSAFFMVIPPQNSSRKNQIKILPPVEAYLKHLLMVKLSPDDESTIAFVAKQLQRLPWNDPTKNCGYLVCKYMLKACRKGRYGVVNAVLDVASSLKKTRRDVAVRFTDSVLEELQWSMENPSFRDQQRAIQLSRLLGVMHGSALVPSSVVFEQLYHFINFGHKIPKALLEASEKQWKDDNTTTTTTSEDGTNNNAVNTNIPSTSNLVIRAIPEEDETQDQDEHNNNNNNNPAMDTQQPPAVVAVSRHSKYDPRVPSNIDPPFSVLRIKLVCSLLESVGPSILTTGTIPKLQRYLTCFQRYLFTKSILPAEVKFAVLDLFDSLESRWKEVHKKEKSDSSKNQSAAAAAAAAGLVRYPNWLDAHNAAIAAEETEALIEARSKERLMMQGGTTANEASPEIDDPAVDDLEGNVSDQSNDEDDCSVDDPTIASHTKEGNSEDGEDISDSDSDQDSDSHAGSTDHSEDMSNSDNNTDSDDDDMDELQSDDMDDDSEDDDMDDDDEIDEAAAHEAYMKQLEEEAFERELRKLTMDALEKGKVAARSGTGGKVADTMVHASNFVVKKHADTTMDTPAAENEDGATSALGGGTGIKFKLLKRGHKGRVEAKPLVVPMETNLAKQATKQDDEAAKERDMLKARVLQYEAESSEQYSGNVYMDQTKLQVIRNRPLSMEDIDRNFGCGSAANDSSHGNNRWSSRDAPTDNRRSYNNGGRGGGGGGRFSNDGGRGRGGRTLRLW